MPQIFRAIAAGVTFGAITAIVLSLYLHRVVPHAREMRWAQRIAWALFAAAVTVGSVLATAAVGRGHWFALSDPNSRSVLFVAWIVPVAVVLRQAVVGIPQVRRNSGGVEITNGALRTIGWGLQLFLFALLAAAAVALWMSAR